MTRLRTAKELSDDLGCSEWTVMELVRQKKVDCVRVGTTDAGKGLVRFTDEQAAQIVASLTVKAETATPMRRKRRAS